MRLFESAQPWEYRWRIPLLFLTQPLLSAIHYSLGGFHGAWYTPEFSLQVGLTATAFAGCGLALRVWGTSYLTAPVVIGLTARTDRLIVDGPFALVRNPLYLGTLLIFAGFGTFFGWPYLLAFVVFHWVRSSRVIRYEESMLRREWRQQFEGYCRAVPRWIPNSLHRHVLQGPYVTVDGLVGNAVFVGMFVGFAVSTWWGTLDPLVLFEALGWGVALWALLRSQAAKRQSLKFQSPHRPARPLDPDRDLADQSRRAG